MGLLRSGEILSWRRLIATKKQLKARGISQFANVYKRNKLIKVNSIAFGDELELMMIIKKDGKYKLYCGAENVIGKTPSSFVEYARYMVETSALTPFNESTITNVEEDILERIENIRKILPEDGEIIMLPCFFNLKFDYFYDTVPPVDDVTYSLYFPFNGLTRHKRFSSFTENIRNRRGRNIEGYVEIMAETNTRYEPSKYILIDSMGQGMGCCGLQVTIQGKTMDDARYLYDVLAIMSPLFLRLSRGVPIANGRLLKTETRWQMIEMSVDCRTDTERGSQSIKSDDPERYPYDSPIPKSRFSPVDLFISNHSYYKSEYNDTHVPVHKNAYNKLRSEEVDRKMAKHIASLFVRDPMVAYECVEDNENTISNQSQLDKSTIQETTDDFENIQSSNWRSVRFKIPTENAPSDLRGWKVELRSMDIQATVFENTALIYFAYLLSEAILVYDLNVYIQISLVDTNFKRANAFVKTPADFKQAKLIEDSQLFYYRRNIKDKGKAQVCEGTLRTIFLGEGDYKGLIKYVYDLIDKKYKSDHLRKYINFIEDKLNNEYISLSDWIRKFVINHPEYKQDSVVEDNVVDELIEKLIEIKQTNSIDYLRNE